MAYADVQIEVPEFGLAKTAPADEFYRLGLVYSNGEGVAVDILAAHKWFNLAAARGHGAAKLCREEMADMLTPADVITAQRLARQWMLKAN
jgi:uncharacterized protein